MEPFKVAGSPCQGYRVLPPAGSAAAVMHVVHGMAEHAQRYQRLAEALAADGWAVYLHDQRGHGASITDDSPRGHFADVGGWPRAVDDLGRFIDYAAKQHPGRPLALFGHSMGSFVVLDDLARSPDRPLAAAILSGPAGPPTPIAQLGRVVARFERWRRGRRGTSPLMQQLSFGQYNQPFRPARTEFDWLSKDPAEVDKYVADPLCGFEVTTQFWVDLLDTLPAIHDAAQLARIPNELPIRIFAGEHDPVGRQGKGVQALVEALRQAGCRKVEYELYPSGRHEMLNEINREQVVMDLKAWLAKHNLPGAPS